MENIYLFITKNLFCFGRNQTAAQNKESSNSIDMLATC